MIAFSICAQVFRVPKAGGNGCYALALAGTPPTLALGSAAIIVGGYVPTCSRGFARSWAPGANGYTVRLKTPATLERRNVQHCVHHMNVQVSDNAVTRSLDGSVEETKRIYLDGAEYSSVEACRVGYTGAAHASENSERIDL